MYRVLAVAALGLLLLPPALAAGDPPGPSFRGVGDAPGGDFFSKAYGVSPDGRIVVGSTETTAFPGGDKLQGFRWENGTLERLGRVTSLVVMGGAVSTDESEAFAVSAGGGVVGRVCANIPTYFRQCAAARFEGTSPVAIQPEVELVGEEIDWEDGAATDITADGSAIYGSHVLILMEGLDSYGGIFRWQDSVITVLGSEWWWVAVYGSVMKVSPDGGAYAYTLQDDVPEEDIILHRLGEDTNLGPGYLGDVSKLGLVVVGVDYGSSPYQAARWHGGSLTRLGDLPGGSEESGARAVSDAGDVIAGWGTTDAGMEAFLWTADTGMRRLADVLTEHGLDVSGWTLKSATGLSASGRTVVGWGINPNGDTEGFVATLPARVIPTPALGRFGLALLVVTLIASASAAVRRGLRPRSSPATR